MEHSPSFLRTSNMAARHCVMSLEDLVVFPELLRHPTAGAGQEVWLCYLKSLGFKRGLLLKLVCFVILCLRSVLVQPGDPAVHLTGPFSSEISTRPPSVFEHGPRPLLLIHNSNRQPPSPQTHSLRPAHNRHTNTRMFNTSKPPEVVVKVRNIRERVRNMIKNR